ncbi:MAG: glycosyltransferase family 2 protein [Caldilineaceae bacterium]|nr:glycosyltransferase family 2 protein [Caldilineaceae bacterium]MDE0336026.1 glycosyltransferase family 2 protein [Caldilineaceae bacterium]
MSVLQLIYIIGASLLAIYGLQALLLTLIARRTLFDAEPPVPHDIRDYPSVTVQLPVFNERHVVRRLIDAVAAFDWPADRLQIQILDDSTDDTSQIIASSIAFHRRNGIDITQYHRTDRKGYKAGALRDGLTHARGEFIAIFDADFVPPSDFLQRTISPFDDPEVGCVQARWGHLNASVSRLTLAQSLGIDGHFVVEQRARNELGALLNFNGTAGLWRRSCMDEAGGWQEDTLTEDLDLSYRAQLCGWRVAYLADVIVPAEIPVSVDAFKRQQFRWAKGSMQTARKLSIAVLGSGQPLWRKLLGIAHLTGYAVHPLMLLNLLFLLPMMSSFSPALRVASLFSLTAIGPPLMYWTAMQSQGVSVRQRIRRLFVLLGLGTGLSVNNSRAVFEALLGVRSAFKRTPKFAVTRAGKDWHTSTYVLPSDPTVWAEIVLALYANALLVYSLLNGFWWLFPWLSLYAGGYTYISYLSIRQAWEKRGALRHGLAAVREAGD